MKHRIALDVVRVLVACGKCKTCKSDGRLWGWVTACGCNRLRRSNFRSSTKSSIAGRWCWGCNLEDPCLLLAASPLQLDIELTSPRLTTVVPPISALQGLVPGGFEIQSRPAGRAWCAQSHAPCREKGVHPEGLLETGWLNNRHKASWVALPLGSRDAGMKTPAELFTSGTGHVGYGRSGAHEGRLEVGVCWKLCDEGPIADAVNALTLLVQRGCHVPNNFFYRVLKQCSEHKDLVLGRRIHILAIRSGYEGDAFLATHLIGLYASNGRLEEAMRVFNQVSTPSSHNWASIIFANARHGDPAESVRLYRLMRETAVQPDNRIYVAVLKACATARDLVTGREVHGHILERASNSDIYVQTGLVHMFAKCGSLDDARSVFDKLSKRNVVLWNTMIAGYAQQGLGQEAISLYDSMQRELLTPDSVTYVSLLQACASEGVGALDQGKQLHSQIEERGLQDVVLGGSLVNMYAKCGSLQDARWVFDMLPTRNVVSWTAMIAGYAQQGLGQEALSLYKIMQREGLTPPDSVTYVCLLQACASVGVGALDQGRKLHAQIVEQGLQADVVVGNSLVNMYAKCGSLGDAHSVFDRPADSVTFVGLLQACAFEGMGASYQGKRLHAEIEHRGLQDDVVLGGSLVNMYAKCGSLEDARSVFERLPGKHVVTWNAMLAGYVQQGMGQEALTLYTSMQEEKSTPNSVTFVCLLQACASVGVGALDQGKQVHSQIDKCGLKDVVVVGSSLVTMYSKCGSLGDARSIFDALPARNVVTWTAMIAAYAQQGMGQEALCLYGRMQQDGLSPPDAVTYVCLLLACATVAALPLGKQLHAQIEDRELQADPDVGAALVNMYAKCGSMSDAKQVFDSLLERTIEAWNALIGGYCRQGDSEVVFNLVEGMREGGLQPDGITFLSVLTVCSHVGLVDKGRKYFEAMKADACIRPSLEHFVCMMDLLGRAGHLDEALRMAKSMHFPANGNVWRTLLGACRMWNNVEIGQQAFDLAVGMDGKDASSYLLMSNIYESTHMWEAANAMHARRVKSGAWKEPAQSWWIDVGGVLHTFVVGDKKHSKS